MSHSAVPLCLGLSVSLLVACGPGLDEHVVDAHTFAATQRCTQGPLSLRSTATGARWGEGLRVFACTPRAIRGHVAMRAGTMELTNEDFGDERTVLGPPTSSYSRTPERRTLDDQAPDNARCVGTVVDRATVADGGAPPSAQTATRTGGGEAAATSAAAESPTVTAQPATSDHDGAEEECLRAGLGVVQVAQLDLTAGSTGSIFERGDSLEVRIWSDVPNDLEGVTFYFAHSELRPNVSDAEWERHLHEEDAQAQAASDAAQLHCTQHPTADDCRTPPVDPRDTAPAAPRDPPPPARAETLPPRPSVNADWVPGYYVRDASHAWAWLAGFWRVPDSDIAAGLTTHAPVAPPAPRAEVAGTAPVMGAVWVPGSWAWSGSAWVWLAGQWQVPPSAGASWRAPEWQARGGLVVLLPGLWVAVR